ncbi:MAG: hypothetical protein ABIQ72_04045 [Usitatibacter sp.]
MRDLDSLPVGTTPRASAIGVMLAILVAACVIGGIVLSAFATTVAAQSIGAPRAYDHSTTGFVLSGSHIRVRCETCHAGGIFKGTSRDCASCHRPGSRIATTAKPSNHVQSSDACETCHQPRAWTPATFSHDTVAPGTCASCHNGTQAPAKPAGHVATNASCDSCHRPNAWKPATFTHSGVVPGTCASCHNGFTATGKTASHVPTSASCDSCHRTTAWKPANFSHTGVVPGTCASCHNGSTATGKTASHVPTSASCDSCHRTTAWKPATFSHTGVVPGTCATCHNGTTATGKNASHFVTSRSCDACHRTAGWAPATTYSHVSPFYKQHQSGLACASCHKSNNKVVPWPFAAYRPDCAGCHAADFKPDEHKKVDSPRILYTAGQLKDCTGSCHTYTDATFTRIRTSRSGQHRATSGSF